MFPIRTHYIPKVQFLLLGSCRKPGNQNLEPQPGRCRKPYRVVAHIQELEGAVEGCLLAAEATQLMVLVPAGRRRPMYGEGTRRWLEIQNSDGWNRQKSQCSKTISSKDVQLADVTAVEVRV